MIRNFLAMLVSPFSSALAPQDRMKESLSDADIDQRFQEVKQAVASRWDECSKRFVCSPYVKDKTDEEILNEYARLHKERIQLWETERQGLFKQSTELLSKQRYRSAPCTSFEHSQADGTYNATCIEIGNRKFLAMEGPLEEHLPYFFRLLTRWNVSCLVCLTGEAENNIPKCHPYWQGRVEGRTIKLPMDESADLDPFSWRVKQIPFFAWHDWMDHAGVDPEKLLTAARFLPKEGVVAVHCSGGVGRTGTFIAAAALVDAIGKQSKMSISELFVYLNLHRPWMINVPAQYLALHRMVDFLTN